MKLTNVLFTAAIITQFCICFTLAWVLVPQIPDHCWPTLSGACVSLIVLSVGCLFGCWSAFDDRKKSKAAPTVPASNKD